MNELLGQILYFKMSVHNGSDFIENNYVDVLLIT